MFKVMLIDDEESIHGVIRKALEQGGYAYCGARDAEEGLACSSGSGPTCCCSTSCCRG